MIENTEINVDQLIQKIRNEVEKSPKLSPLVEVKPIHVISGASPANISYIETLLNDADFYTQVPTEFPQKFNRFPFNLSKGFQKIFLKLYGFIFKKQRVVNSSLSQSLRESLVLNRRLSEQINTLQEQINTMINRVSVTEGRLVEMNHHFGVTNEEQTQINNRVTVTEGRLTELNYHLSTTNEGLLEISNQLRSTKTQLNDTNGGITDINERLTSAEGKLLEMVTNLLAIDERHLKNDSYLKNDLSQQKRLITMFLEEAKQRFPEQSLLQQLQTFEKENQHSLDALYVAFEDQFRGSRDLIFNRLKVYLPLIKEANIGTSQFSVLDMGCGRGEWLELLRESGYNASGIDINKVMLEQCKTRGLEVIEGDVISYLQSLPDASLGALTGFHIIEHLPFSSLIKLFDEAVRVLKSGGLIIFETPNPRNVLVGSGDFYRDPTHLNPIHPDTISYIATLKGFINSESYFFEEKESGVELLPSSKVEFETFDNYVTVSRDFVLIAYKP